MRIGAICQNGRANSWYRVVLPLRELERRGHTVFWPGHSSFGVLGEGGIPKWDLLHIHQFLSDEDIETVRRLRAGGVAVVWDSDDDILGVPKGSKVYRELGRRRGVRRTYERSVEIARAASAMTTTNENLARVYRDEGVEHVTVIENFLAPGAFDGVRPRHQGVVVGIVAAGEHEADLRALRIDEVLMRVLREHPDVQVLALGCDLKLKHPRYVHQLKLGIEQLVEFERNFDIGLAPLVDSTMARSRSNVKVKEYAAAGAMWLASPVGPYVGMGEQQGGRLVDDAEWFPVLDGYVRDVRARVALAKRAVAWAQKQTARQAGDAWEAVFRGALRRVG